MVLDIPIDVVLLYCIYFSIVCFVGIFVCGLLIAHKHGSYYVHLKRQRYFQSLLHGFLDSVGAEQDIYIDLLNKQIERYPIDCVYGGVREVENLSPINKKKYLQVASFLRRENAILCCINSSNIEHQCIGIEAIGLGNVYALRECLNVYMSHPILTPFAIEALCSLDGIEGFEKLTEIYSKNLITTAQALTALSKIDIDTLRLAFSRNRNHPLMEYYREGGVI